MKVQIELNNPSQHPSDEDVDDLLIFYKKRGKTFAAFGYLGERGWMVFEGDKIVGVRNVIGWTDNIVLTGDEKDL